MDTNTFGRFGNMNPPHQLTIHPYTLATDPFCIKGNLYFVGTAQNSVHLIDTGSGLIIIDVPPTEFLPYVVDNIWRIGFDPKKIKLILISHAHGDHYASVNAIRKISNAQVAISEVDAHDMAAKPKIYEEHVREFGPFNENFTPDFTLQDGQVIEIGNTKIRCVLIPGHTLGVMAHFWDCYDGDKTYNVGIYGGAGFITLQDSFLQQFHFPTSLRDDFLASIDKVWDEPVDIMLGNHPFHNDTWKKRAAQLAGDEDAFVDPDEWHRYLTELRESCKYFLSLTPEEAAEQMKESRFMEYSGKYLGL